MPRHLGLSKNGLLLLLALTLAATHVRAEDDYVDDPTAQDEIETVDEPAYQQVPVAKPKRIPVKRKERRKYITDHPDRSDAGIFHVAFAVGGNFYNEPKFNTDASGNLVYADEYFKDFGYQAGVYFDYDYSQMAENIPLALRGMVGYKYILNSVHVFSIDAMVRRMFQFSEKTTFGIGAGGSMAVWFRNVTAQSPDEETALLPSFLIGAGFEFNPFMVDFKWLINRIGAESTIMGVELYFGVRL